MRHVNWAVVRCLIIAGPGFAKDGFRAHLEAEAVRRDLRRAHLNPDRVLKTLMFTTRTWMVGLMRRGLRRARGRC